MRKTFSRRLLWVLVAALSTGCSTDHVSSRAPSDSIDLAHTSMVVREVAADFESRYVFPEKGRDVAAFLLSRLENGAYKHVTSSRSLAHILTKDIRFVTRDMHATVKYSPKEKAVPERSRELNVFDFVRVDVFRGNIGYIDLRLFTDPPYFEPKADAAMRLIAGTDALIIDLRNASGGNAFAEVYFCSSFFSPDMPVELSSIHMRGRAPLVFRTVEVPVAYVGKPIYILTSRITSSAAEAFAYDLSVLGRATVVGEATAGGAHVGHSVRIDERFEMFVPTGRAENPLTSSNWERIGVTPHLRVASESALRAAIVDYIARVLARSVDPGKRNLFSELLADVEENGPDVLLNADNGAP